MLLFSFSQPHSNYRRRRRGNRRKKRRRRRRRINKRAIFCTEHVR